MHFNRIFPEPQQSYFLLGPRGTGKSTLVQRRHPSGLYINLLESRQQRQYIADPDRLLAIVRAEPAGQTIIIDEIQKVPALLSLVHVLIEEKKQWQFVLTGSSARKLKRESVNLLGGRALNKTLHPFMATELGHAFDFSHCLTFGMLPIRFASTAPGDTLAAYVSLYLDEEVKTEGWVRDLASFSRFLEVLSFSHGSILNLSNIARECGIKRATADLWLSIVEDLLIVYRVPIFTRRAKRHLVTQSKLYYFDVGVYRALRPTSVLDRVSEIEGHAVEGLVAQYLRAWIDYTTEPHHLFYWRTKSGVEVDFIVFGTLGLWAIEVKNSEHIHPTDLRSLKNFREDYPEAQCIFLYRGREKMLKDGIVCLPCETFILSILPNKSLLPV